MGVDLENAYVTVCRTLSPSKLDAPSVKYAHNRDKTDSVSEGDVKVGSIR